jgi:hypothetical protein
LKKADPAAPELVDVPDLEVGRRDHPDFQPKPDVVSN